jgi:hypothetical protein
MNREDIEEWIAHPNHALNRITISEFKALCELALRNLKAGFSVQGEPVAWCVGYDDPRFGLIPSNPTMCKEDAEMTIKKACGKLRLIPLTYADAPPADGVVVPRERMWNLAGGRDDYQFTEGWNACRNAMLAAAPKGGK